MSKILFGSTVLFFALFTVSSASGNISGAIFTTDASCSGTNVNSFDAKIDVYLDGGPVKEGSAGLPDGYYYVQVTAPNGELLGTSNGAADSTPVHVTNGSFDTCYQLWPILIKASDGSIGYDTTPNGGGVYKVWVTPAANFDANNTRSVNGFLDAWSKTDNFKVEEEDNCVPCPPTCDGNSAVIKVRKFDDTNANGIKDQNEPFIEWAIDITDPEGGTNTKNTSFDEIAFPGTWQFCEEPRRGWLQTGLIIDGVSQTDNCSCVENCASVQVNGDCNEVHEVLFGNIELSTITACKFYDADGNGINNNEEPVEGIKFILDGNDIRGNHIVKDANTGPCGCVFFRDLLPGTYTLCEVLPQGWVATTDVCKVINVTEGNDVYLEFGNVCVGTADFDTKGYWHNKNGLAETGASDLNYLNSFAPWQPGVLPFGPINGYKEGSSTLLTTKLGSTTYSGRLAEQSIFLVYSNGDYKLQLAQQLDAFIMNLIHRLDSSSLYIQLPDGKWKKASDVLSYALWAWKSGSNTTRSHVISLLDALNNSDNLLFIHPEPCPIVNPCPCTPCDGID